MDDTQHGNTLTILKQVPGRESRWNFNGFHVLAALLHIMACRIP